MADFRVEVLKPGGWVHIKHWGSERDLEEGPNDPDLGYALKQWDYSSGHTRMRGLYDRRRMPVHGSEYPDGHPMREFWENGGCRVLDSEGNVRRIWLACWEDGISYDP